MHDVVRDAVGVFLLVGVPTLGVITAASYPMVGGSVVIGWAVVFISACFGGLDHA